MRRVAGLALVGLLLLLFAAPSAQGYPFTRSLSLSYLLAVKWWEREPEQCSEIDMEIVPDGSLGTGEAAVATVPPPSAAPYSIPCQLFFTRQFASFRRIETTCALMVHEVGHLLGYQHSEDPSSPMYFEGPLIDPRPCREAGSLAGKDEYFRILLLAES